MEKMEEKTREETTRQMELIMHKFEEMKEETKKQIEAMKSCTYRRGKAGHRKIGEKTK